MGPGGGGGCHHPHDFLIKNSKAHLTSGHFKRNHRVTITRNQRNHMDRSELFQLTARLRRAFPRVMDVLSICDEAERLSVPAARPSPAGVSGPKRDRAAYMRSYRARKNAGR